MPEINILDKHTAELIAAGEVVERPASVVKELMENAIDAGATAITAEIRRGGITYIRITDNGCGIDRSNIRKAFISHATSKIKNPEDLDSIFTLGFRGEALASVAAVSRVEILTRIEDEQTGTRYCIEGSEEILLDDAGCPKGTTIIVRDIFYNTPARMKFLKKDVTEANAVAAVVDRIALSHPEISVKFIREGKQVLSTHGDGNMLNTVFAVFGKEFSESLIKCEYELGGIKISGFVSKPVFARANRTMQFFFLNGRLIKTKTGMAALEQAYKNSIMVGKFPSCVLNINVPFAAVDVNVHPAKTEVRFADERKIFDAVYYCTKIALEENDTRVQMSFDAKAKMKAVSSTLPQPQKAEQTRIETFTKTPETPKKEDNFFKSVSASEFRKEFTPPAQKAITFRAPENTVKTKETQSDEDILLGSQSVKKQEIIPEPEKTEKNEIAEETREEKTMSEEEKEEVFIEPYRIIGQAFKTYIFIEQGEKVLIIDKHAAHERMIFDSLKKSQDGVESQMLLMPVTVTLSKEEYSAVLENRELLKSAGYCVDDFGQGMVIVTECPTYLESGDIEPVIIELAGYLCENRRDMITQKLDWIFHSTSCRAAIKAGDRTTDEEIEKFVGTLLANPDIRYCPHGRPVLIEMSRKEIEKNFGRI